MKQLLILGFLVLAACAAPVSQDNTTEACMVQPTGSTKWYPCGSEESKAANCLNLMELAMKSVDPYLDSMSLPEETRDRTMKLWDRAKNSCWSDLKDLQPQHYH